MHYTSKLDHVSQPTLSSPSLSLFLPPPPPPHPRLPSLILVLLQVVPVCFLLVSLIKPHWLTGRKKLITFLHPSRLQAKYHHIFYLFSFPVTLSVLPPPSSPLSFSLSSSIQRETSCFNLVYNQTSFSVRIFLSLFALVWFIFSLYPCHFLSLKTNSPVEPKTMSPQT